MALPVEILFGIYLGLLTGILPALVAGTLGFVFRYFTGVTVPGFAVVVLGLAIAGVNGGFLGLLDETIKHSPRLITATLVVLMVTLYAHSQGDRLGATFPRRMSLASLRRRTLSPAVVERVGGWGEVTVEVDGEVDDVEGYLPLPPELRAEIAADSWRFPADLPLAELETRLADRLRSAYDLPTVTVSIDERARATVAAAAPAGGLSRRVPSGKRAVSVNGLLPTGMARGEAVTVHAPEFTVEGTLLSARSGGGAKNEGEPGGGDPATDGGEDADDEPPAVQQTAPVTDGGGGRATVAVDPGDAERLLSVDGGRVLVRSRGSRREYELVSLLRQAGTRFRKLTVREAGVLDGTSLGDAGLRDGYGVRVLGVRHAAADGRPAWAIAPDAEEVLSVGDELFVVGPTQALDRLEGDAA